MPENGAEPSDEIKPVPVPAVATAVKNARSQADAMDRAIAKISADHLRALLADPGVILIEHLDDPELTQADRARLRRSVPVRPSQPERRRALSWSTLHRTRMLSRGTLVRAALVVAVLAAVLVPILRHTAEFAIVTARFSTVVHLPNGQQYRSELQPGQTLYVRRWLRAPPTAVMWVEDVNAYATAPMERDALSFPGFPYFD